MAPPSNTVKVRLVSFAVSTSEAWVAIEKSASAVVTPWRFARSACTSWYRWQGAIEQGEEQVCTIKSRLDLFPALCQAIRSMHPYEVPEILASPVVDGSAGYLAWLEQELRPVEDAKR